MDLAEPLEHAGGMFGNKLFRNPFHLRRGAAGKLYAKLATMSFQPVDEALPGQDGGRRHGGIGLGLRSLLQSRY